MIEWICYFVCGGKARKNDIYRQFYRCGADLNNAKKCTIHTVDMELVRGVILAEIQHHAKQGVQDESGLVNGLLAFCGEESKNKKTGLYLCKKPAKSCSRKM